MGTCINTKLKITKFLELIRESKENSKYITFIHLGIQSDGEVGVLFILSNNCVDMYDIKTLNLICKLKETQGSTLFTLDEKSRSTRLMVYNKKLISFLYTQTSYVKFEEYTIKDVPREMKWIHECICLAFERKYQFLKLDNMESFDIQIEKDNVHAWSLWKMKFWFVQEMVKLTFKI